MVDLLDLALVVIALFSAIFVAITGGIKLTLGYRGSEDTTRRKKRIDEKLKEETKDEMLKFVKACSSETIDNATMQIRFEELGYEGFVARNITTHMLAKLTSFMESSLKLLVLSVFGILATLFIVSYYNLTQWTYFLIFLVYVVATIFAFSRTVANIRKNYSLRKALIYLDENPKMEIALELRSDLLDEGLL